MRDYSKYKTDEERIKCLDEMELTHYTDWVEIPRTWEDEAKTETARNIIHNSLHRMARTEEYFCCGSL